MGLIPLLRMVLNSGCPCVVLLHVQVCACPISILDAGGKRYLVHEVVTYVLSWCLPACWFVNTASLTMYECMHRGTSVAIQR